MKTGALKFLQFLILFFLKIFLFQNKIENTNLRFGGSGTEDSILSLGVFG